MTKSPERVLVQKLKYQNHLNAAMRLGTVKLVKVVFKRDNIEAIVATGLWFDGESSYVEIPTIRFTNAQPFTFEAWVTPDENPVSNGSPHANVIVTRPVHRAVSLRLTRRGDWLVGRGTNRDADQALFIHSDAPAATGRDVHVAVIFDGTQLRFYVDGVKQRETIDEFYLPASGSLCFGGFVSPENGGQHNLFRGTISGVRISKNARYTNDFTPKQQLGPDADTVALYHFNEGDGEVLRDVSGNRHHGEIVGAKWINLNSPERTDKRE